ncbi:MAG: hypothetical protein ABSF29_02425 [Tepidisphaeraceae bacterium]
MLRAGSCLAGVFVLGILPAIAVAATDYNVVGIAPLAGDNFSTAFAINNSGEIIGISYDASIQVATSTASGSLTLVSGAGFYDTGATPTVIPALGADPKGLSFATPDALNDSGEVVGASTQSGSSAMAGFIDIGGVVTNATSLFSGVPLAVNNSGVLIAADTSANSLVRYNGTAQSLSGLTSNSPLAYSINNAGVAIGASQTTISTTKSPNADVVEWPANSTTPTDLGGLSGFAVNVPFAINSAGDAVGYGLNPVGDTTTSVNATNANASIVLGLPESAITTGEGSEFFNGEAFLYSANTGKFTGLGNLGGGFSMAEAVNNSDEVVGMSLTSAGDYHAFLYDDSTMTDLNTLLPSGSGWTLINADGINSAGDIVGYGDFDGTFEAYELTPSGSISGTGTSGSSGSGPSGEVVPLPAAFWSGLFLLAGLSLIATVKRPRPAR